MASSVHVAVQDLTLDVAAKEDGDTGTSWSHPYPQGRWFGCLGPPESRERRSKPQGV